MQVAGMARLAPLVWILLVGGCTLIDQRTFNPRAGLGPIPPPGVGPPPPLIAIDFAGSAPVYEASLRQAVDQAIARKPTVVFEVATVVSATGTLEQQAEAASSLRNDARDVARIIAEEGVDADRINLVARSEAGAAGRQVLVMVR